MAYPEKRNLNSKEEQFAEADISLSYEITATDGGASYVFDTESETPGLGRVVGFALRAGEDITVADTDTLKVDIQCAADATGDTDTLFSETYTEAGGGSTWSEGQHLLGIRATRTSAYTYFTDVVLPPTATRYIKVTLTSGAEDGTDDKKYNFYLLGSNTPM